jgi:hypothetical protein
VGNSLLDGLSARAWDPPVRRRLMCSTRQRPFLFRRRRQCTTDSGSGIIPYGPTASPIEEQRAFGTILPQKLSGLPAPGALSLWTGGTRGGRRALPWWPSRSSGETYHATKAVLAGLRSRSICSAVYRNGHDWTAHIVYLISRVASVGGFLYATGWAAHSIRNTGSPRTLSAATVPFGT